MNLQDNGHPSLTSTIRVLIVDDSFVFRQAIGHLLRRAPGMQVVGRACNGQHALRYVRRLQPDIVLTDINMPVLDGIDATRAICAEFPDVSVIGLSSYALHSPEARALRDAGAVEYLCKDADGMGDAVIAAIRRRMMQYQPDPASAAIG